MKLLSCSILFFSAFMSNSKADIVFPINAESPVYPHPLMPSLTFVSPEALQLALQSSSINNVNIQHSLYWGFASPFYSYGYPYGALPMTTQPLNSLEQLNNMELNAYLLRRAQKFQLENPYPYGQNFRGLPYFGFYPSAVTKQSNILNQPERINNRDLTHYLLERAYRFSQE